MTGLGSIFAHARARPERIAVLHRGRAVSYREFAARIVLTRRFLQPHAAGRARVAVLCVQDILDGWIIRLALRGLGVTCVSARSAADIARLAPAGVVSTPRDAAAWPGFAAAAAGRPLTLVPADAGLGWEAVAVEDAETALCAPGGHMLLTSGTTGLYKKVLYDDDAEAQLVAVNVERAGITAETVFDVLDFGGWTGANYTWPMLTWAAGGRVLIDQGPEPWRSLAEPSLTHAVVTPYFLTDLMARPSGISPRNDALRLFVVGGVLSQTLWRETRERLTGDIYSVYGATESCHITYTRIETVDDLNSHHIHAADALQVVDDQDWPLPRGQVGVVRIRTAGVDGYLDDPETSRAFFRDGYFYPGDLGVVGPDGRLILQGRVTDVINVLGNKIATAPIETMLQDALDAVAVCVFSVPGKAGEEVHVAIQPRGVISAADLKAALLAALPREIADVQVHSVRTFPRNGMGKIERAKLKDRLLGGEVL